MAESVIFGVDPGSHRLGWGAVIRKGSRYVHVDHGVCKAPADAPLPERLRVIAEALEEAIRDVAPSVVAIEQAFFHRDPHAALVIGHARGVAMLLAARAGLTVVEYPPAMVKRTVVGSGRADKAQVTGMIRAILGLAEAPQEDAADALAVAICHASGSAIPGVAGARRRTR
ncbi:MAG: crossover junction endodeoxyribonuclease RuvC [Polyangiales bacterium]